MKRQKNIKNRNLQPLYLSIIGTTSGGKSTIGNLLCGQDIFPSGVQETTTSALYIRNSPYTIPVLYSSLYPNGQNLNLSRDSIHSNLLHAMKQESKNASIVLDLPFQKNQVMSVPSQEFEAGYFLYGIKKMILKVPNTHQFVLNDMPGLLHQDDRERLEIIKRLSALPSIILFVFNAEETDEIKENTLLNSFLSSCFASNYSPHKILFVVNKMDVFLRDRNFSYNFQSYVSKKTNQVSLFLEKYYGKFSFPVRVALLCAEASFYIESFFWNMDSFFYSSEYEYFLKKIQQWFEIILPETVVSQIPRSVKKWTMHEWCIVCAEIRKFSGYEAFFHELQQKINVFFQ